MRHGQGRGRRREAPGGPHRERDPVQQQEGGNAVQSERDEREERLHVQRGTDGIRVVPRQDRQSERS